MHSLHEALLLKYLHNAATSAYFEYLHIVDQFVPRPIFLCTKNQDWRKLITEMIGTASDSMQSQLTSCELEPGTWNENLVLDRCPFQFLEYSKDDFGWQT